MEHSRDLQTLRLQSQQGIEQLQQAHQTTLEEANAEHQGILETQVKALEKQISMLNVELKATRDDLAKAKSGLEAALALETTLRTQIEQKDTEFASLIVPQDQSEEVVRLTKELANAKDDLLNLTEAFAASKESFQHITGNHQTELEEAAKARAEEVLKLKAEQAEKEAVFRAENVELLARISGLEVEVATLKAAGEAQPVVAPSTPRKDTNGAVPGVTKEELQRMHEAHNLKLYDLEASHEKVVKELNEKLEAAINHGEEMQAQAEQFKMEVTFVEQSAEDADNEIKQYVKFRTLILSVCFALGFYYYHHSIPTGFL